MPAKEPCSRTTKLEQRWSNCNSTAAIDRGSRAGCIKKGSLGDGQAARRRPPVGGNTQHPLKTSPHVGQPFSSTRTVTSPRWKVSMRADSIWCVASGWEHAPQTAVKQGTFGKVTGHEVGSKCGAAAKSLSKTFCMCTVVKVSSMRLASSRNVLARRDASRGSDASQDTAKADKASNGSGYKRSRSDAMDQSWTQSLNQTQLRNKERGCHQKSKDPLNGNSVKTQMPERTVQNQDGKPTTFYSTRSKRTPLSKNWRLCEAGIYSESLLPSTNGPVKPAWLLKLALRLGSELLWTYVRRYASWRKVSQTKQ